MVDLAVLVLRLGLGVMFAAHGLQKAFGMFGGPGISGFSGFLSQLGFPAPLVWAYVAAYTELIGGLLLVLGISVRVSASFLLVLIAVATYKVHLSKGFFMQSGGIEYNLIIACACMALILIGPGKLSLFNKF
ncbi:MAG: DoxX family protein [Candidatus Omnitrophota bacterium]